VMVRSALSHIGDLIAVSLTESEANGTENKQQKGPPILTNTQLLPLLETLIKAVESYEIDDNTIDLIISGGSKAPKTSSSRYCSIYF
ncbi:MAG: hypothetical protein ACTH58_15990, partial [Marinomonas foliarum]|uniref:hypothetical protein n=1 Tax=Marinomonas foliarum TaxID=491950 RepID=UPI003F9DFFC2